LNSVNPTDLNHTIASLQKQFGDQIITKASSAKVKSHIPTGFQELDSLLDGGIPRGRVTHLMGNPTSGMTTLGHKVIATIQQLGEPAVYIDLTLALDTDYLLTSGINPAQLILLRPSFETALSMLFDVVAGGIAGGIVFNATSLVSKQEYKQLATVLERLHPTLAHSNNILLLLTRPLTDKALSQYAAVRLMIEFVASGGQDNEVNYQGRVTALKYKQGREGKTAQITIALGEQSI
jgi:RecA/RadA recombinase